MYFFVKIFVNPSILLASFTPKNVGKNVIFRSRGGNSLLCWRDRPELLVPVCYSQTMVQSCFLNYAPISPLIVHNSLTYPFSAVPAPNHSGVSMSFGIYGHALEPLRAHVTIHISPSPSFIHSLPQESSSLDIFSLKKSPLYCHSRPSFRTPLDPWSHLDRYALCTISVHMSNSDIILYITCH